VGQVFLPHSPSTGGPQIDCADWDRLDRLKIAGVLSTRRSEDQTAIDMAIRLFLRLSLCFSLFATCSSARISNAQADRTDTRVPSSDEINRAIIMAAEYLEDVCHTNGSFAYLVDLRSGQEIPSYNIIRHLGAMYALGMLNRSQPDPRITAVMVRAANFVRQNYMGPGAHSDELVVWARPLVERADPRHSEAELGAASLGIVALAEVRNMAPESVTLQELQALGRFALFMQREDGSFVSKYRAGSGPDSTFESLYYPGEAALAFITLYEADHSRAWLVAASKALSYLARSRAGLSTVPVDHWALIATAKLLPYCEQGLCGVTREELVRHATQICNSMLHDEVRNPAVPGLEGAFEGSGRTTPTATRLEGLLAALEFLPKNEFRTKIEAAATGGIAFLLRAQVKSGPNKGGMPGVFLTGAHGATEVRIDYVQHALSAWIRYREVFQGESPAH
jgi:hypothetical protein